jgi:hypothetical protein
MPIVCYRKPNRTKARRYTAKDAGRIICYARKNGYSQAEIVREAGKCLDDFCDCERVKQNLRTLLELLAGALIVFAIPETLVFAWLLRITGAVGRYLPAAARLQGLLEQMPAAVAKLRQVESELKLLIE